MSSSIVKSAFPSFNEVLSSQLQNLRGEINEKEINVTSRWSAFSTLLRKQVNGLWFCLVYCVTCCFKGHRKPTLHQSTAWDMMEAGLLPRPRMSHGSCFTSKFYIVNETSDSEDRTSRGKFIQIMIIRI